MTMDRRGFLYTGGFTIATIPLATGAHAAPTEGARNVTEFGVEPNVMRDQTAALQKALFDIANAGQIALLPAGVIAATRLALPPYCNIAGVHGTTILRANQIIVQRQLSLSGVYLNQHAGTGSEALLSNPEGLLFMRDCFLEGKGKGAINLGGRSSASLDSVTFSGWEGVALLSASSNLSIHNCSFSSCGTGLETTPLGQTSLVNNRFKDCGVGAGVSGIALVNGNMILGAKDFGLRLGSAKGDGHIICQSNLIRDCRIGIGVAASGDDIMASLNMITGAKDGAIRAFDGDKLVGPDLARQSAEAYLNLMVAGNVVR